MAQFDIDGARAAGYDDDEIADFLGARLNFDTARARESGYSGSEIIDFLRSRLTPADADPNIDVRDVQARTGTASALETANLDEAATGIYPGELRRREPKPEQPAKPEGPRGVLDTVDLAEPFTPADERAFGRPQPPMGRVTALPEKTPSEQLGERVGEATGSKGAGALARGVAQGEADIAGQMWGVIEAFSDATGLSGPADFARQARRAAEGFATGVDARSSRDPANQFLQTGARGFTANVPALTLTAATGGGVPTSLGLFGVQSFGSQYGEGRDAGLDPGPAFLRAAALTIPEVASELLPTEHLLRMGGAAMQGELQRTLRAAVQAMLTDIPGEQLNQIAAFLIDKAPATGLNPNATPEELRQQLAETLYHTIAQGVMFAGAGAGLSLARRPSPTVPGEEPPMPDAAEMVDRVFRARADRAAAAQARENAQRAQEVATILDAQTVDEVLDAAQAALSRPSEVEIEPPPPAAAPVATAPATAPTTPQAVPDTLPHTPDAELLARVPEEPAAPPPAGPATVDVEAAAAATSPTSEHPEPTEAQKEAGNYRKGHVRISGLDISIENPAGSKRRPEWPTLRSHYGYIRRTEGADGDHVDVFVRPGTPDDYAGPVFVVDQVKENGEFDEHKVMLGFDTLEAARAAYLENYTPDWQGLGAITALDMPAFVEWTRSGDTTKPLGDISAMSNAVKQANASAKAAPEKPAEGESGVVKWTKAKIIPTRQGVKAVPEPAPAPAAAPGAPSATLSRKAGWDFERTFPEPRFDELDRAGGLSTFDASRDADDLADTVADWHRQFIEELGRRAEAFRTLDHAVRTGKNPQTGKPLKKRDAMRDELREERNNQRRLLRGLIEEYGAEFGDDAAAALAKHAKLTDVLDAPDLPPVAPEVEPEPTPAPAPAPAPAPVPAPAPAPTPSPGAPPITEIVSRGAAAQRFEPGERIEYKGKRGVVLNPPREGNFLRIRLDDDSGGVAAHLVDARKVEKLEEAQRRRRPQVSPNKVFTEEAAERARALLRKKLGQVSAGIDPEIMQAGITLAGYHIERGARTFAAYARAMIEDLGDIVRPYLKSWYLAVKYDPRAAAFADEMDDAATVERATVERATVEGGEEAAAPVPTPTPAPAPAHAERAPQFSKPIEFTAQTPAGEVRVEASRAARVPDERHTYVNFRLHGDMVDETGSRLFYSYAIKGDPTADEVRAVGEELANRAVMQYAETWWKGLGKRDREALIEVTGLSLKPGVQWRFIPAEDRRRLLEASAGEPTMAAEAPADVDAQPTRPEAGDGPADRGDGTDRDADRGSVGGRLAGAREGTREERPADRGADEAGRDGEGRARARDEQQPPGEARDLGDVRGRPAAADVAETPADHSITDADRIGEGGLKSKYRDNVAAIRLLKELEREGKRATYDQQRVLARYVGWGGLKGVFDPNNKQWAKEYAELKELLTPDEYERARRTILDAHYTSPEVIKGIYGIMRRLGFTGGRVLEPSIGAGHFIGLMPSDMRAQSAFTGVELDRITGLIAQHLYPTQNIIAGQGFQEVTLLENSFDAAVGNPPFGDQTITDLTMPQLRGLSIHNFFFAKSIHAVRPGGLMVMVVSRYFMDARDARARRILAKQAKLLGAVRLPRTAFRSNANTEVVTDVLVFQKYASGETRDENPDWLKVDDREIVDGDARGTYAVNTYFSQNPDHILGRESPTGTMYARNEYTVVPGDESIADGLRRIAEKLPANVYEGAGVAVQDRITDADGIIPPGVRPGNLFVTPTGHVALRGPDIEGKPTHREFEGLKDMAVRRIKGLIEVRDALRALMRAELTGSADDAALDQMRAELNKAYDKFVKKFGYINRISNRRAFVDDVDLPLLESLEPNYDAGISPTVAKKRGVPPRAPSAEKAPIFSKRVLRPFVEPTSAATAKEALLQSMNMRGHVDMAYMSALYGKPEEAIAAELEGLIFRDPSQGWVTADEYLSGNVKAKLEQARAAAKDDPTFEPNVKALEAVQPAPIAPEEISVRLGSPWVPGEDILAFAKEMFGPNTRGVIQYMPAVARWTVSLTDTDAAAATSTYGTRDVPAGDLLEALLNNKKVEVRRNIGTSHDPVYVVDEAATLAAQAKAKELGQAFRDWIWNSAERRERLAKLYNDKFNANVDRKYDGSHLSLPGKSPGVNLRPHQKNVIWRALQDREILLDHVVGAGKTFAMVGIAMEARRLGILRKPMFVVPNHLVGQWRDEFYRLYPNANILAATEKDFEKANRERLFARITTGDWDAVIVAHSSLKKIGMPPAVEQEILGEMSRDVSAAIQELKERRGDRNVIRDMERIKVRLDEKMKRLNARSGKRDKAVSFDELGVDGLFVDEAHLFKNLYYFSQMQNVAGLGNPAGSARAFDLFVKVRYLQSQRGTKGMVAFATGTPVSNSLVEMFTMQRYMMYDEMRARGMHLLDAWAGIFGDIEQVYEVHPSGSGYRLATRFSQFVNMPELMQLYRSFADVITMRDLRKQAADRGERFPVPNVAGGKPRVVVAPRSDLQRRFFGVAEFERDENGRIRFEADPGTLIVQRGADLGKKGEAADKLYVTTNDPQHQAVRGGPFETEEQAREEIERLIRTPKVRWNENSILWKYDHLRELTKDTKGKINALSITNEARKAGLDYRLIDPNAPDFPDSKVNKAVAEIVRIYRKWDADKGTQLVFCDLSVPQSARDKLLAKVREQAAKEQEDSFTEDTAEEPAEVDEAAPAEEEEAAVSVDQIEALKSRFSVYDDVKSKLIAAGIPENQIAFIHDYDTSAKKLELYERVRRGEVRVLMGSTEKMGAGMNVQSKLVALHHLDAPWRPSDLEQREGRIIRQGNEFYARDPDGFEVEILRYATEQTYDTRMWQLIEHKANGVEQLRNFEGTARKITDVSGEAANAAEMKAAASGNPLILEEIKLRNTVQALEAERSEFQKSRATLENALRSRRSQIEVEKKDIAEGEKLIAYGEANPSGPITVNGTAYEKPADAAQQIVDAFTRAVKESAAVEAAKYRGLTIYLEGQVQGPSKIVRAYGESKDAGVLSFGAYGPNDKFSATGLVQRVDNLFARQPTLIKDARNRIAEHERQIEKIGEELKRTWPKQEKLAAERRRHHEITQKLARAGGAVQMTEDMRAELREALKARGLELIGEVKQDVLPYGPDGEPEPGPIFYSELLRQVEGINAKAMTPGDWEVRIRSLKGVKRDELEWSGLIDWLKTQTGRLTKEDVVAFLRENGVQVQEVVRGGPAVMTDEINRLIVELDAAGYDGAFTMVRRRADNVYWEWNGERFVQLGEADADPMPDDIEAKLLRLIELDAARDQREEPALPKYAAYQLPGGENYTELLLTLPAGKPTQTGLAARKAVFDRYQPEIDALRRKLEESGGQSDLLQQLNELQQQRDREADAVYRLPEDRRRFMSGHWNEPNIVAHVRFNERKAADGKRVLFIEEIQSDWAQRGRERGFAEDEPRWPVPGLRLERYQGFDADRFPWMVRVGQRAVVGRTEQEAIDNAIYMLQSDSGLPRAPFVEKTEQWVSLALKRMIRWAAEHGFDRIAWTTGRQQTDRYDLRERIEKLRVLRAKDGRYYVRVKPAGKRERELFGGRTENELIDLLGKNLGQRVLNDAASAPAGEEWTSPVYEAADIEIGGDGMLQFYDRILPNIANDVLKKLGGGRVGIVDITIPDVARPSEERGMGKIAGTQQPGFDITPAMRQRAMVGLPLFQPGIDYGLYQGGGDARVPVPGREPARRIGAGVQPARGGGRADRGDTYVFSTRVARDVGGSKPRPRILAKAIADEFRTAGVSYLNGKVVRGPDDVAALAQVWRDPRYETFRIIFTRNGRIVHATAVSSRMPGRTVAFASNLKTREQIREHLWSTMRSSDADGYYLLHNHPSGDPSPSHADIALTFEIADNVPGFKGHVIINSGRYAVLEGKELRKRVMPLPNSVVDEVLKPALPSAVLGRAISNQNDVAAVGKLIQRPDWIGVIMQSGSYGVRVLAEMPPQLLDDYRKAAAWIRRMATQAGGGQQTFLALPEVPLGARREALRRLQADGFIIDAVANGGMWSLVATGSDPVDMNLPYGRAGKPVREMVEQDTSKYDIEAPHFDIPAETRLDAFNRYISDNLARLKATQDSIREQGGDVDEFGPRDVYRAAERFPGIVTDRIDRFVREEVEPLFKAMDEAGITPDELALFAYAKHAPERNEYIASINERFAEGAGSGMSDEDAAAVIEQAKADGKLGDLEDLHQRLLGITAGTRQLLADEGLISPEEAASWATQYENYVPLRGFEHEIVDGRAGRGTGQGFSIRGRESIAAMGRRSRAGQIIENILLDRERAVLRAEKNRVGKALLDLVTANPDDSLWQVNATRQKPRLRTVDGISEVVYETRADEGDHVFSVKVGGREVRISLHDPLLATAMKNLTDAQVGPILGFMQRFNSMLSRLYTGLNPVFVVLNGFRDYVAAMIQAQQYEVDGKNVGPQLAAKITKHYRGALAAAMRFEYGKQRGAEWDRWFAEYSAHGGRTGYMALKSLEEKVGEVQRLYRRFDPNAPLTRKSWAHVMRLVEAIEGINQSVENATRAAAYRAGRELGMSPAQAASVAKNITVNFNRRGELTRWIAPFFLFWNASVQGTATFLRAMRHGRVQAAAGMLTAAGIVMSLANIAIGGDDDDEIAYWDKIPDYEKERNLIIMLPPGDYRLDGVSEVGKNGRYVKIPLPYGYNPFVVFGNSVVDALRNMKDGAAGKKPMRAATNVVSAVLGSYNPAGGDLPMTSFAPVAQPAIQWYFNVNRFGDPLYPEPQRGRKTARAAQFFDYQRGSAFQVTADALNRMTGGNSVRDGLLSIQPGVLENTFRYFTGGLGQSAADALSPLFELHEIGQVRGTRLPFYRQLYGEVGTRESRRMFQEVRREAQAVADEIKALYEANEPFKITDETALMMRLAKMNDRWNKALSRLRKEELAVREDKALSVDERRVRLNRIEFERRYLYNAFLATWKRGMQQVEARGE